MHTSGGIDKLEVYRRIGVREVWFWIEETLAVYRLAGDRYRKHAQSVALRGIDLELLASLLRSTDLGHQAAAVRAYRRALQGK